MASQTLDIPIGNKTGKGYGQETVSPKHGLTRYEKGYRTDPVAFALLIIVFIYVFLYPPFIISSFTPVPLRLSFEALSLLLLALISIRTGYARDQFIIIVASATIFLFQDYLNKAVAPQQLLSSMNKVMFLVLIVRLLLSQKKMFEYAKFGWILIWTILSLISIIAFVSYISGLVDFEYLEFGSIDQTAGYTYYSNFLLGNVILKNIAEFTLPRITGYIYEPGQLAFFFGYNAIITRFIILNSLKSKLFFSLNIVAGLLTFSMTFTLFMIFFLFIRLIHKLGITMGKALFINAVTIPFVAFFIFSIANNFEVEESSSYSDRMMRFEYVLLMMNNINVENFLFGSGIGFFGMVTGYGINSGLVDLFFERGILLFGLMSYLFIMYSRYDLFLLSYIAYYFMFFNFTWSPIFLLSLAIGYASYMRKTS